MTENHRDISPELQAILAETVPARPLELGRLRITDFVRDPDTDYSAAARLLQHSVEDVRARYARGARPAGDASGRDEE
jgi:hypothetical protein